MGEGAGGVVLGVSGGAGGGSISEGEVVVSVARRAVASDVKLLSVNFWTLV